MASIVSSAKYAEALGGRPFASVASFYPDCLRVSRLNTPGIVIVSDDVKQPALRFSWAPPTNEPPPANAVEKLHEAKSAGVSRRIGMSTLTLATCWDYRQLDGRSKTDLREPSFL